ncbi:Superoxide reductase [uncultured archaeon]|nr:Superoxide reductase [uncultured archaeon]
MADDGKGLGDLILTYNAAAGEALGKREGHTPKIEVPAKIKSGEAVEIKVAVGPHPNTVEHSIRWIEVYFYEEGRAFNPQMLSRVEFSPMLAEPEVKIKLNLKKSGVIHAMEYCNMHGLWSNKKEIVVE